MLFMCDLLCAHRLYHQCIFDRHVVIVRLLGLFIQRQRGRRARDGAAIGTRASSAHRTLFPTIAHSLCVVCVHLAYLYVCVCLNSQSLPSADELFASDTSLALSSSHSVSVAYRSSVTATSSSTASDAAKRRLQEQEPSASSKRLKPTTTTTSSGAAAATRKAVAHFAPPQLKRPNVSTEDLGYVFMYVHCVSRWHQVMLCYDAWWFVS